MRSKFKDLEMSYVLPRLSTKKELDTAIKGSEDKVLVLRFGREDDAPCMQLDDIVSWQKPWAVGLEVM